MLKRLLPVLAALVLVLPAAALGSSTRSESTQLLQQMNVVRAQHGLAPLSADTRLSRAAQWHNKEMIDSNVFGHGAFGTRMSKFNVTGRVAGENLAWGTGARGTARGIVDAWLASPEHRANLLRPSFRRVGVSDLVSSFRGYSGAHVVTADFAG